MSAARKAALLGAAQLYYKATGFLIFAVAARYVPAPALGELFTAMAFAGTFVVAVGLGLPTLVMRRVAQAPESAAFEASRVLGFRLVTLPVFVAAVGLAGAVLRPTEWPLWAAAAAIVGAEDAYGAVAAVFLGLSRPRINVTIGIPVQSVFIAAGVAGMVATGTVWGLVGAQAMRVTALVAAAWLVSRYLFGDVRPRLAAGVLTGAFPFAMAAGIAGIVEQADPLLVGLLGTSEQMAHYQLALRTLAATSFVPIVVSVAVYPFVARQGLAATRRLVAGGLLALALGGAGAAVVALAAPGLLARALFGAAAGADVAPILSAMAPLFPLAWAQAYLVSMLQASGQERAAVRVVGAGAAASVAVAVPGILALGPAGAVAARTVATAAQIVLAAHLLFGRDRRPSPSPSTSPR